MSVLAESAAAPGERIDTGKLGGRAAWYALLLVCLTQAMSMVDRQILAILMPQIKADLQIGDAEMGLLYGTVFALFYAVFSLPLGRLADGWARTKLLSISIFGWSIMTALAGFANGFGMLAFSRLGVGIGEASVQPAGMSLLSDVFPKKRRGTFTAMVAAAIALGLGGALLLGGAVADNWDAAYANGGAPLGLKGWQAAFIAAAIPGLVLSILLAKLPEPVRGAADGIVQAPDPAPFRASWDTLSSILPGFAWANLARFKASPKVWAGNIGGLVVIVLAAIGLTQWTNSLRDFNPVAISVGGVDFSGNALQWIVTGFGAYVLLCWLQSLKLRDKPSYAVIAGSPALVLLIIVTALQTIINYGVMAWTPTYLIERFELNRTEVGLIYGVMIAAIGIVGPLVAGPLSDFAHTRIKAGRLYVTLAALVISPFLSFLSYRADSLLVFYLSFACFGLVLTMWLPPIYATFMDLVLPRMRGMVMSFYILTMTITGLGLGPYTVGLVSDLNGRDFSWAILSLHLVSPVIVALTIFLIMRLPKDEALILDRARAAGEKV